MQADLDRVRRGAEHRRHLLGGQLFDVAQHQDHAIRLRQPRDRRAHEAARLRALQRCFRRLAPPDAGLDLMSVLQKARQILFDVLFRLATARAQLHQTGVDDDAMQPRREQRRRLEL